MYYLYLNQYTLIPIVKIQYALIPIVKITIGIRAYYLYLIQYTLIPVVKIQYALIPSMIYLGQSVNTVLAARTKPNVFHITMNIATLAQKCCTLMHYQESHFKKNHFFYT